MNVSAHGAGVWSATDTPPEKREAQTLVDGRGARCGACNGRLQDDRQFRCPYVRCRKWLRTAADARAEKNRRRESA